MESTDSIDRPTNRFALNEDKSGKRDSLRGQKGQLRFFVEGP
jgi:hypothetical protein